MSSLHSIESLKPTDLRKAPRHRVLIAGKLYYGAFNLTVVNCLVLDLSTLGARVETPIMTQLPELFKIQIGDGDNIRDARRCWSRGNAVGLEFITPMNIGPINIGPIN